MSNVPRLPEQAEELANELAALARKYKLREFHGGFAFSYHEDPKWPQPINFHWKDGRHGEESYQINLHSEFRAIVQFETGKGRS